ncbi:unnamed protein product [Orchesella dallaii]|uniref:C2H2-type domain-containing protein n=1 Tax=Orchesella dallaii TaxID=48710 RepID=A0ABP1Q7A1_9HEXA
MMSSSSPQSFQRSPLFEVIRATWNVRSEFRDQDLPHRSAVVQTSEADDNLSMLGMNIRNRTNEDPTSPPAPAVSTIECIDLTLDDDDDEQAAAIEVDNLDGLCEEVNAEQESTSSSKTIQVSMTNIGDLLYAGIKIHWMLEASKNFLEYLKCGICSHCVCLDRGKNARGGGIGSAYDEMKYHILEKHLHELEGKRKQCSGVVNQPNLTCPICTVEFADSKSLEKHKKRHGVPEMGLVTLLQHLNSRDRGQECTSRHSRPAEYIFSRKRKRIFPVQRE